MGSFATAFSSNYFTDIYNVNTDCGIVWQIDFDQIPRHVKPEKIADYINKTNEMLCNQVEQ